jgi:uncharacterized membrane protein YdjX (TVP38/TMEM64 family)
VKKHIKWLVFIIVLMVVASSPIRRYVDMDQLTTLLNHSKNNPLAPFIYILVYVLGVIFGLPGTVLTVIAAPIFGFWQGLLLVIVGANIGCQIPFWISRSLGRNFIQRFIESDSFMGKASKKIEENGFLFMLYIRLLPIFPFNGVNYLSGLTQIRYRDYTVATLIGMIPGTVVYVYISHTAVDIRKNPLGILISLGVLILFTLIVGFIKKKHNR